MNFARTVSPFTTRDQSGRMQLKASRDMRREENPMPTKTLEELRAEARARGLTGYSRLTKAQLRALLDNSGKRATPTAAKRAAKPPRKTAARTPAKKKSMRAARGGAHPEPTTTLMPRRENAAGAEESIEAAKYALTTAGMTPGGRRLTDLLEDIDRLPTARNPQLGLLPQKPGVLHAYWALPAGADVTRTRLRLCRLDATTVEILEEVALPAALGHWYFHVPEGEGAGAYCVHLGRYDAHGNFVSSFERAIARLPTLYAEARPDRQWWVSEARFRAMYLRAGGVTRGHRLGWPGSFSSR